MKILFYDQVQNSNAPRPLKTPLLSDKWVGNSLNILWPVAVTISGVGIGYTDATEITVNGTLLSIDEKGLYEFPEIVTDSLSITHNGSYIGRFAAGVAHSLGLAPPREPGFHSSHQSRRTRTGGVIPGAGGYTWRTLDVDIRYKFTKEIIDDIQLSYPSQIGRGFPLFVFFSDREVARFPWKRFYGTTDANYVFQSSVNKMLYSKRFSFREAF